MKYFINEVLKIRVFDETFSISPSGRASLGSVSSEGEDSQNDAQHILTEAKAAL